MWIKADLFAVISTVSILDELSFHSTQSFGKFEK